MPQSHDKTCSEVKPKKYLSRSCIRSMQIPQSCSQLPSRSTIGSSQTCSRVQSPGSISHNESSYTELFCTSETCSNSVNCFKTLPEFCPHGLKEKKDEEIQLTTCHSDINTTKSNFTNSVNSKHNMATLDIERQDMSKRFSGLCPAAVAKSTLKQSNSFHSSNESMVSSMKSPCGWPAPCSESQTERRQSKTYSTEATSYNTKMNADALRTTKLTDTGTNPIPDRTVAETDMSKIKSFSEKCTSSTSIPNKASIPDEQSKPSEAPELNASVTNNRKRSSIRTSFQLSRPETDPVQKGQPMATDFEKTNIDKLNDKTNEDKTEDEKINGKIDENHKSLSCPCTEAKEAPPVQKKCSCHFPPAYNQFGCTGNISGSCNCSNDNSKKNNKK